MYIPDKYQAPFNIVSIDPGSNFLGFCVITIDPNTFSIIGINAKTLYIDDLPVDLYYDEAYHGNRLYKLMKIKTAIYNELIQYNPLYVVCEAPYYNRFRPGAFAPLVEVIGYIQLAVYEYNNNVPFTKIEPSIIKKLVGANAIGDKHAVKKAVFSIDEIVKAIPHSLELLDEHAIDAIAIGYSYCSWFRRKNELCL